MQNGGEWKPMEDELPNTVSENYGISQLHQAVVSGNDKLLDTLLQSGVDRNIKDPKHGNTPLHEAAWRGFSQCVKLLCTLPKPKIIQKTDKHGKGSTNNAQAALHSALLGIRNYGGFSALHLAAQNGHNQSCREILLAGADPDVQNNYGDSPLHTACRYGHAGATRILLSAKCDPQRVNLNGDTALHIACAMGRRKLTKILLEAGTSLEIKNAQNETPRDIAIRKNLIEIIEILDKPLKANKSRDISSGSSKNHKNDDKSNKGAKNKTKVESKEKKPNVDPHTWSPYGCHYFPDPRSFPQPRLETLPKEPLNKGEQYYLDLAGNIRKGPIGIGNTCYCGPFFRHIEEKITRNKKHIKRYVTRATEKLDSKVQELASKTEDQIGNITRSMIADRIRCEGQRLHFEHWLKRGDLVRATIAGHNTKSHKDATNTNTLTRCRSLELLDSIKVVENIDNNRNGISRSYDLLETPDSPIDIARDNLESEHYSSGTGSKHKKYSIKSSEKSEQSMEQVDVAKRKSLKSSHVADRLEELLAKTNEIIEMEKVTRRKNRNAFNMLRKKKGLSKQLANTMDHFDQIKTGEALNRSPELLNDSEFIAYEMERITASLLNNENVYGDEYKSHHYSPEIAKEQLTEKEIESRYHQEHDQISNLSDERSVRLDTTSSIGSVYVPRFSTNARNTISNVGIMIPPQGLNFMYHNPEFEDGCSSSSNTVKSDKSKKVAQSPDFEDVIKVTDLSNITELNKIKSQILKGATWRSQVLQKSLQELNRHQNPIDDHNDNENHSNGEASESSEDEDTENVSRKPNKLIVASAPRKVHYTPAEYRNVQVHNTSTIEEPIEATEFKQKLQYFQAIDKKSLVPKDAYFHELPNRVDKIPDVNNKFASLAISTGRSREPIVLDSFDNPYQPQYENLSLKDIQNHNDTYLNGMHNINMRQVTSYKRVTSNSSGSSLINSPNYCVDQMALDREQHNDSGYSTKLGGSSIGPSPSLSGRTESDLGTAAGITQPPILEYDLKIFKNAGASSLV